VCAQVENGTEDFSWGCVVNFQRKSQSKVRNYFCYSLIKSVSVVLLQSVSELVYVAEVLLRCASDSVKQAPNMPPRPPPDGDKGEMLVSQMHSLHCRI